MTAKWYPILENDKLLVKVTSKKLIEVLD